MPRCLTRVSLALLLLLSSEVWALGLGEVRLDSALNEPLRAQIELLAASPEEVQDLKVALASPETFERYGLERPFYLQGISFEVVQTGRADGNYILLRSATPMTEPFLTILVEATWSNGRLLREYTVLLDPPTFAPRSEAPAQPEVTAPERTAPADSGRIEPAAPPPAPEPAVTPRATEATPAPAEPPTRTEPPFPEPEDDRPYDATTGEDYPVVRGDTLWGIASRIRPDSRLTMNQTMLAIFEANPEAFGGNINILRAGARLRVPSADEIFRIDRTEAFDEARRQNEEWQGGAAVVPAPVPVEEPEARPSLTLVPPDEAPAEPETGAGAEPADQAASREQEILDRIAELESADVPVQDSLIEIRDNELANLRRELAEIRGEAYEPPADEPFVEDEAAADTLIPDDEETGETAEPEAESPAADVAPERPDTAVRSAPRKPEPSLIDTILGWVTNVWVLLGVALLLVIAILAWFMRRSGGDDVDAWSSRVEPGDATEETMASTESLRAPSRDEESILVVEQTGRFRKRTEETVETRRPAAVADETGKFGSLEDTFSSETAVNLDQSDPIAEADFHMAYGLYDQAADLMNGALRSEPERQDLLTKLCEIYFVWGNRDSFVDAAQRLKSASRGVPDDWDKIVIMGQQIAPDEDLFSGVAGATKAVDLAFEEEDQTSTGTLDMDFGIGDSADGGEVIDLGGGAKDDGIDFVFDEDVTEGKTVEMPSSRSTVEMPTIEEPFGDLDDTAKRRSPAGMFGRAALGSGRSSDATTEIDLDELGLDLDDLAETELASLADDDATELASLDDLDRTGTNEQLDEREDTGRNPEVSADDTNLMGTLEFEDDAFSSTRTGMRLAPDETGVHPARSVAEETGTDIDPDLLAATGRTQVLSDDYAVETFGDEAPSLGDDDKTMLASSLGNDDFDFAKTEALPPGTYSGFEDATGELPALGSTDVDLDLDDLTEALRRSEKGDTVEQPRDDATVEHRRPVLDEDDTDETLSFAPGDISEELDEARTMTEVGTKLDLARAYVDMGDPAGARSILEEVLDEGDSSQRQQAQKLLDSLPS